VWDQPADMRDRDDVWKFRKLRRRHLVERAADIHRRGGDTLLAQRHRQCRFVDAIALDDCKNTRWLTDTVFMMLPPGRVFLASLSLRSHNLSLVENL
jgi:hypothetical protein